MNENTPRQSRDVSDKTIGELVAADYRTARVFEKYGIDFCCGGKIPLATACRERRIDPVVVSREIEEAGSEPLERSQNYAAWGLPFLADYIINTHHAYLNENLNQIAAYANKIAQVHGAKHPEVIEIAGIFARIAIDMAAHLREEEDVLFPAIKRIDAAVKAGTEPDAEDRATLKTCLAKLDHEHEEIGAAVHTIRHISNNYLIPDDVCNTFMLTYRMLKEFEDDLHKHVHLENNILFPKAAQL
ncbi:MAG: iron-sulfur cluster repair di-iron protein [Desulfuromonadales bacterium]|nr:iron-sulfur cluster repair di-iron protein [Desulfuromonadales bacterium]